MVLFEGYFTLIKDSKCSESGKKVLIFPALPLCQATTRDRNAIVPKLVTCKLVFIGSDLVHKITSNTSEAVNCLNIKFAVLHVHVYV